MILQSDNLMKEKQKEFILHEEASQTEKSVHSLSIDPNRWRQHIPPQQEETFYTPERPAPAPAQEPFRAPVGQPQVFTPNQPEIQISDTQYYNINSPRSRSPRKAKHRNKPMISHDVRSDVEDAHMRAVDETAAQHQRQEELRQQSVKMVRAMLDTTQNTTDVYMTGRGEKRVDDSDPAPAKPKAKVSKSSPKKESPADEPETKHEPKGRPGRPPHNTPASSSTDIPPQPSASSAAASKKKPVKKEQVKKEPIKQKGNTPLIYDDLQLYFDNMNGIGTIREQMALRKMPPLTPTEWKSVGKKVSEKQKLVKKIYEFDMMHKK